MNSKLYTLFFLVSFFLWSGATLADDTQPTPTQTSPAPTQTPKPSVQNYGSIKALVVHKPLIPPAWGHVIQYHRTENFVLLDNNRETLYEFVLQDDSGVIRTAIYHENTSGEGYWEVTVWDQP